MAAEVVSLDGSKTSIKDSDFGTNTNDDEVMFLDKVLPVKDRRCITPTYCILSARKNILTSFISTADEYFNSYTKPAGCARVI